MGATDFDQTVDRHSKSVRQEELILAVTEAVIEALVKSGKKRSDLAKDLGRTKGYVSQLLNGGSNLTLRTLADLAGALNMQVRVELEPRPVQMRNWSQPGFGRVLNYRVNCPKTFTPAIDYSALRERQAGAW